METRSETHPQRIRKRKSMDNCILRFKNVRRAVNNGYELTPTDHIILTQSDPLVHVEWQFSARHDKISFSATMAGDDNGCRFKQIAYSHPDWWTDLVLPMTVDQEDRAWEKALELDGRPYDLIGLASFGTKWDIIKPHDDKDWCNEACGKLVKAAYQYGDEFIPHFYHPVSFFFEMYHRVVI